MHDLPASGGTVIGNLAYNYIFCSVEFQPDLFVVNYSVISHLFKTKILNQKRQYRLNVDAFIYQIFYYFSTYSFHKL